MRPSKNNPVSVSAALLAAAGLGTGAVLGWTLRPAPAPASPGAAGGPGAVVLPKPTGKPDAGDPKSPALPYDIGPLLAGGFDQLAEFEIWLRSASCGDTGRVILGMDPGLAWKSPAAMELLVRRFREFSADERMAALSGLTADGQTVDIQNRQRILGDLAEDALPRRAVDFLALAKMFSNPDPWVLAPGLKKWAAADLPAVLDFIAKIGGRAQDELTGRVMADAAETHLPQAQEAALKLPQGQARLKAMAGIARAMAKKDLGAALDWLNTNQFGDNRNYESISALRSVIRQAAVTDGPAAAQLVLDRPGLFEGEDGRSQVDGLFQTWIEKDAAGAAAWLEAHPLPETWRQSAETVLAGENLRKLPLAGALASLGNLPAAALTKGIETLSSRLQQEDPEHAMERFAAALPEKGRAEALAAFAVNLPFWQFDQAAPYMEDIGKALENQSRLTYRLSEFPEDQLKSVLRQLPEKAADLVRTEVLDRSFDSDSGRAIRLAQDAPVEKLSPFNASRVAVAMAQEDPAKAAAWVAGFPEGENKEWAAQNLAASWGKYDPAAAAWVRTLPPGPARDRAARETEQLQSLTGPPKPP